MQTWLPNVLQSFSGIGSSNQISIYTDHISEVSCSTRTRKSGVGCAVKRPPTCVAAAHTSKEKLLSSTMAPSASTICRLKLFYFKPCMLSLYKKPAKQQPESKAVRLQMEKQVKWSSAVLRGLILYHLVLSERRGGFANRANRSLSLQLEDVGDFG